MPEVSQSPTVHGRAPVGPPLSSAQYRGRDTVVNRLATFAGRQCPGVFTPDEFAGEGFFLPEQPHRDNVDDVRVVCW